MERLPEQYCISMKQLLGEEYGDYLNSLSGKSYTALRLNTGKVSMEQWERINPFHGEKVSWTEKGYYYDAEHSSPAKHPYYYAGLYYVQEPSAMIPASILPIEKGNRVLDLCAAPGGKATELGAKLGQQGLLVANDISASRAAALVKNIQFAGITNAVVTAETPQRLCDHFGAFFDKILIDAPCSGEGMFRREPRMVRAWMEKGPSYYAPIQKEILSYAYEMLKPGGQMVYSTCTFSIQEDEEVVQWLLEEHHDMHVCPVERKEGFCEGRPDLVENGSAELKNCIRIFPHCANGEGHFAVLLEKEGSAEALVQEKNSRGKKKKLLQEESVQEFWERLPLKERDPSRCLVREKDKVFWDVFPLEKLRGLRVLYQGLSVCEIKHKLNPAPQLALTLKREDFNQILDFSSEDEQVIRYLKGETLLVEEALRGDVLVCVDGYGLGWCKGNGQGSYKNKYHPGWRYQ